MTFLTTSDGRRLTTALGQRITLGGSRSAPYYPPGTGEDLTTNTDEGITTGTGIQIVAAVRTSNHDIQNIDLSVNLLKALLWQYNEALNLQGLLEAKQDWYNTEQEEFWQNWIRDVFDLRTANEFGLSVWSIILGLPLFVSTPPDPLDKPTWGFGSLRRNFNRGNFSSRTGGTNSFSIEVKRIALRLRYYQLVSSGTVPEINRFLAYLFADRGGGYVLDLGNMRQRYIFNFVLPSDLANLFKNFDILPRPAGVGSTFRTNTKKYFGFGPFRFNFNRGNFGA